MAKYSPQTWGNTAATPVSAARLTVLENGIREASMGRSTTFPASPVDGDIHVYPADTTLRVMWMFMYRSVSAKWEFIGGAPLWSEVETDETTGSASYANLATTGPSITVPKAGEYLVQMTVGQTSNSGSGNTSRAAVKIGGAATSDEDSAAFSTAATNQTSSLFYQRIKTCAASDVLLVQYNTTAGTASFRRRRLMVTPVWVTP